MKMYAKPDYILYHSVTVIYGIKYNISYCLSLFTNAFVNFMQFHLASSITITILSLISKQYKEIFLVILSQLQHILKLNNYNSI